MALLSNIITPSNVLKDSDIGTSVQAYDADTTKNDVANTFTADQTITAELIADSYNESYNAVTSTSSECPRISERSDSFSAQSRTRKQSSISLSTLCPRPL